MDGLPPTARSNGTIHADAGGKGKERSWGAEDEEKTVEGKATMEGLNNNGGAGVLSGGARRTMNGIVWRPLSAPVVEDRRRPIDDLFLWSKRLFLRLRASLLEYSHHRLPYHHRSPFSSSSKSPLLSPPGGTSRSSSNSTFSPFLPPHRLPLLANILASRWYNRLSPFIVFISAIFLVYQILFTILDSPSGLLLDPLIDPHTFQLLPPGDPTHQIDVTPLDGPLSVALAADRAERDALMRSGKEGTGGEADEERPRAFWKGDEALRRNRPASRFKCDDGYDGRLKGSLLFLGIFTTPSALSKRQLLRTLFISDLPPASADGEAPLIDVAFISARPPNDNWRWSLEREAELYGDIVWLEDIPENIDTGKTAHFFEWVARGADGRWSDRGRIPNEEKGKAAGEGRDPRSAPVGRPQFVMKVDDDVRPPFCSSGRCRRA